MRTCAICGGPRTNGAPVTKEDGEWTLDRNATGRTDQACRSCARDLW